MKVQKKQSLAAKLKAENDQLRDAARQLHAGLLEYAKAENWAAHTCSKCGEMDGPRSVVWIGNSNDEEGPKTARYFLGLDNKEDKN